MAPQCWQALTIGCAAQKAVVFNENKTFRQDVLRKSSDKFQLRQLHVLVSAMLVVVVVTNPYPPQSAEAVAADGDFVGVFPQILYHLWEGRGQIPAADAITCNHD
jgi:hypothetical protein